MAMWKFVVAFFVGLSLFVVGCSSYFDEDSVQPDTADIIMTVSHQAVFLRYGPDGDGAAECILVMDEDYPDEWRPLLCGAIEGFNYERGYEYTLRVRRTFLKDGNRGEPSVEYRLIDILYMERVEEQGIGKPKSYALAQ